jgi:hypothetical protein
MQRAFQSRRPEKAACDGVASQVVKGDVRAQGASADRALAVLVGTTQCSSPQSTRAPENLTIC